MVFVLSFMILPYTLYSIYHFVREHIFPRYLQLSTSTSTPTSTSTLFHMTIGYNRLARKIAIANLGGPVKRKISSKEKKGKEKEGKL